MVMQWALAHGDTALVHASIDTALKHSGVPSAEESSPDGVYLTARLLLAVGDTAGAARYLDGTLESLPGLVSALLQYVPLAGSLVRMMALRAELAAARGESTAARRWATAVGALWSGAEPPLQPTVAQMKRILAGTQ